MTRATRRSFQRAARGHSEREVRRLPASKLNLGSRRLGLRSASLLFGSQAPWRPRAVVRPVRGGCAGTRRQRRHRGDSTKAYFCQIASNSPASSSPSTINGRLSVEIELPIQIRQSGSSSLPGVVLQNRARSPTLSAEWSNHSCAQSACVARKSRTSSP